MRSAQPAYPAERSAAGAILSQGVNSNSLALDLCAFNQCDSRGLRVGLGKFDEALEYFCKNDFFQSMLWMLVIRCKERDVTLSRIWLDKLYQRKKISGLDLIFVHSKNSGKEQDWPVDLQSAVGCVLCLYCPAQ